MQLTIDNMQDYSLTITRDNFIFDNTNILNPSYIETLEIGDIVKLKVGQRSEVELIYCRIIGKSRTTITVKDLQKIDSIDNNYIIFIDKPEQYIYPRKKTYAKRIVQRLITN